MQNVQQGRHAIVFVEITEPVGQVMACTCMRASKHADLAPTVPGLRCASAVNGIIAVVKSSSIAAAIMCAPKWSPRL
eukprot:360719-Chlamydomonas_euryale.AAC.13